MTQINLGIAYRNRIRGDRAENLGQAITAYTAALQVYTRSDYPALWAATQGNLGNVLRERIRGDQAENLERAITACTAALEVYTRMDFPVEWTMTQINLGAALSDRIKGDRSGNLKQAIAAFQVAIDGAQAMSISDHERRAAAGLGSLLIMVRDSGRRLMPLSTQPSLRWKRCASGISARRPRPT